MSFSRRKFIPFLFLATLFSLPAIAPAQNVRRDKFKWMSTQTEHFDIYYDETTEMLVPRMAHYLERAWHDVGRQYNVFVASRTPFFFYSNHNEFEQTNIVSIGEGTGGVTEAFKNRFLIFNDGSEEWMQHVIYHEYAHVVQFNVLYGGFWKSIRLLKSPFYPLWMMEGMAEFGSGSVDDATGDMVVRDAFAHGQLPSLPELQGFAHLKPNQVTLGYKTGDAAIAFLQDEYGGDKLNALLTAMKDYFDISSGLEGTIGCDLARFDFRFREWLGEKYETFLKTAKSPAFYGPQLTKSDGIPTFNEAPVVSPDGKTLYHFSDRGGPTQLFALDLGTLRQQPILPLKYFSYENLHTRGRALSISPDGRWLAFAGEKKQRDLLYLYDTKRRKLKRVRVPFDELRTPVFSPVDGERLVCVGMKRGFNDLYVIDRKGHVLERLTDSPQDEKDPAFTPDGKTVVFSAEVMAEDFSESRGRNLVSIDLATKQRADLTNDPGSELEPEPLPDGSIIFTRDRDDKENYGFNLYRLDASGNETRLTNFIGGGFAARYSSQNKELYYIGFNAGEKHIYRATWTVIPAEAGTQGSAPSQKQVYGRDSLLRGNDVKGVGEARKPMANAFLTWPAKNDSPLFSSVGQPYRFKVSTDLFIPFFFYSSLDGFVVMDIWQVSDLLGNHQFQQQAQYASGGDVMDISLVYTYARFRPTFSTAFRSTRFYRDFDQDSQRREVTGLGFMTYPLDRVSSISVGAGTTDRKDIFFEDQEPDNEFRDRFLLGSLQYDTVTGRYLVPTKGSRLGLVYQQGVETAGGDQEYKTGLIEASQYIPIPRESAFASRFFYGRSIGEDRQVFRMGGVDRIRALTSNGLANKKSNVAIASAEVRLRIKYLNARTAFLFPDFFFKAAYLNIFNDTGFGWNNARERDAFDAGELENSTGVGIMWPTFILQSFQINFTVQWAHRTTTGSDVWYVSVGPSF